MIPIRFIVPLLIAIFVVAVGGWNYVSDRRMLLSGIERDAVRDLELDMGRLQASLEGASRWQEADWVQAQFAGFDVDTHGILALMADEMNTVLASVSREQVGKPVHEILPPALRSAEIYQTFQLATMRRSKKGLVRLINEGQAVAGLFPVRMGTLSGDLLQPRIGLVLVARDVTLLKAQEVKDARREGLFLGMVLLVAALVASLLMHFLVTRRLARISKAADQLATGDRTARSGVRGRDEIALLGSTFDAMVSDLGQREAALIESEERHRSLFENAVEGIVTMGEDRLIRSMNPAAQKLFGYTEEEVIGKNVNILMPSPHHDEHDGYVRNYLTTGKKKIIGIGREVVGKHKDGATFPLELSVAELQLTHERLFTGILRDISDRKQAEAEWHRINEHLEELVMERTQALADAQEALVRKERLATLGQLAGSVAHEIRNPLGIVQNAAFYLEQVSQDKDTDTVESFAEIRRGLSRANHIITELLEYARDPQTHHRVFDLKDAVDEAFEGVAIIPDVSVMREVEAVQCEGDPGQVSQILRNLIINASQSMPHGGNLTVSGRRDGEKVVVEVRDSGSGISEEQLGKIFEPLFTTKTRGIGLGLALSLRYAELNHATLEVESRLGEGAIFRLILREHPKACA